MSLILVPNLVRRNVGAHLDVGAHLAGHGHHGHLLRGKANINLFHRVRDAFEKRTMDLLQFPEHGLAPARSTAKRIEVIPVFGGELRHAPEVVGVEGIVE